MSRAIRGAIAVTLMAVSAACSTLTPAELQRAVARRDLAMLELYRGYVELSIRDFRLYLELVPEDAEAHFGIGEAYRRPPGKPRHRTWP